MATLLGVYRAVCLEVTDDRVRCKVPQLFADETVVSFDIAGPLPTVGDEGFVAFEGGWAERPVWLGTQWMPPPEAGPPGTPGEEWFSAAGAPAGSLGDLNDWYLDSDNGNYYEKTGATTWTLRGNLTGPAGPTGPTGPAGPVVPLDSLTDVSATSPTDGQVLAYQSSSGLWVASARVLSPLIIPDPSGAMYPVLRFASGDGDAVNASSKYGHIDWYQNFFRYSLEGDSTPFAYLGRRGTAGVGELTLVGNGKAWYLQAGNENNGSDQNLYLRNGSPTGAIPFGIVAADNSVLCNVQTYTPYVSSLASGIVTVRASSYVRLEGNGALGSGGAAVLIGNMYGVGAKNCLSIPASIPGNNWYDRPLTVNKTAGAGEAGIGIVNHVTAWVGQWQLYNTGAQYLGSVNADNSGHIEVTSSKFNTVSARIFKDEIQALRERIASPLERLVRLAPIYHRDLQPALANAAEVPVSDPMDPTKTVLRRAEPQPAMYRFGLVAEDVAAVLPEVVGMSQLGPTLDTHGIVSFLVGCVQELAEQVKGLQQQVVELGGKA